MNKGLKPLEGSGLQITVFLREYRNKAGKEQLEGNIWEAGAEVDGLSLGVSVAGKEDILLNSIHFADPEKASQSEFGGGLTIISTPK